MCLPHLLVGHVQCLFVVVRQIKALAKILERFGHVEVGDGHFDIGTVIEYHLNCPPLWAQTSAIVSTASEKDCVCNTP